MRICYLLVVAFLLPSFTIAAELELVQTIPLKGKPGGLDHLALDSKRDRLLVANKANNTLDVVDLKAGTLINQVPNQTGIQGIAYAPDLDRIYVGLGANGLCNVFDAESYKVVKTIKFADDADNVAYNPKTHLAYVAHAEKSLAVISGRTNTVKADIKLSAAAEEFTLEQKRPRLYVNTPSPCQVIVIDTDRNEVINTYPVKAASAAHPIVVDETNRRLYIGCRKEPMVVILDSETGKEIATAPIAGGVDDLFLDKARKRLYASCGDGFLVVFKVSDADHLEEVEKIPTAKGAATCVYSAGTGRLYLAVPRQEGKDGPEIRVFQAKP
ncbi:MAG TPA: YncE family protein [Gemmataceae bacterium]|nr:YncE family protein [Gemmataceae bacterium]